MFWKKKYDSDLTKYKLDRNNSIKIMNKFLDLYDGTYFDKQYPNLGNEVSSIFYCKASDLRYKLVIEHDDWKNLSCKSVKFNNIYLDLEKAEIDNLYKKLVYKAGKVDSFLNS